MPSIVDVLLLLLVSSAPVLGKPCEVLENLSCECHSSLNNATETLTCTNFYTPLNSSLELSNASRQNPRAFDSFHLTFHAREFNITPMFLNQLSYLFPRASPTGRQQGNIKIILTFQDYLQLTVQDYAFYQLFGEKSDFSTSLSLELTASGQLTFAPMALTHLTVDQMSLHSSSLEPYSFEEIFNNTKIGSLSVEGCAPRSNLTLRRHFNGKIRSAKVIKMAEIVSSEEFPNYPVSAMIIEVHEPRKINASTFVNYYNLNGVHLVRPKFFFDNRSFEGFQYLQNLETIELDAETIKDHTFQPVSRIRFFTLGQNVRYLSEHSFDHLNYLTRLDLSKVLLDQLYPSSKCILARYLQQQKRSNPALIVLPPQAEFCDCAYDFILNLLERKPDRAYLELCQSTQQERCQLSECDVVKNTRFRLKEAPRYSPSIPSIDGSLSDQGEIPPPPPSYVPRHPPVYQAEEPAGSSMVETQDSHASLKDNKPIDPNAPSAGDFADTVRSDAEHHRLVQKNRKLKRLSLSLLTITIVSVVLLAAIVWYCSARRKKSGFERVPPNASKV